MCWSNVQLCSGTTSSTICESTDITYYEVNDNFPHGERDNSTIFCRQYVDGTGEYTIWAAYHNIISHAAEYYRKVIRQWISPLGRCEVWYAVTPWYYMPKRTAIECQ